MTTDTPLVSIIIPTFNCAEYINETIDCLLGQTYKNIEILVINDGSTDNTAELVQTFAAPVRLIHQTNAGVCKARNRGLAEARGDLICFMDHDDFWFCEKLATQIATLNSHPEADVVYSSFVMWYEGTDGEHPPPSLVSLERYGSGIDPDYSGWIYHTFLLDCRMLTSTAMFRRDVFRTSGAFDESLPYSEDWDLWLRISRKHQFIKLRQPNTLYRQHSDQGNRVVRTVDYRSNLLADAVHKWGLSSPDGRAITRKEFQIQLAKYRADYALHQLRAGHITRALKGLINAWLTFPTHLKPLAYGFAALFGWKPSW